MNDATKKDIAADLRKYAMASIDPVITDPDDIFINIKLFASYDTVGSNPSEIETDINAGILDWENKHKLITSTLHLDRQILKKQ